MVLTLLGHIWLSILWVAKLLPSPLLPAQLLGINLLSSTLFGLSVEPLLAPLTPVLLSVSFRSIGALTYAL